MISKYFLIIASLLVIIHRKNLIHGQQINHNREMFYSYIPIYNYDISVSDENGILIKSAIFDITYDCFRLCTQISECVMISYKFNQCKLFKQIKSSITLTNAEPCLFQKFINDYSSINSFLTNYWPFNNNLNDIISGLNFLGGSGVNFATDRLNQRLSALNLNPGYLLFPASIYFKGDFTITVWIKPNVITSFSRIIDCGNGPNSNNIIIALSGGSGPYICSCSPNCINLVSTTSLQIGKWNHIAYTMQGTNSALYVNGNKWREGIQGSPVSITRSKCFLGRSNWNNDPQSINALVDDLKIFNKSLTQVEVKKVLNSYY